MTIASMTAYARQAQQGPWGELVWELRSVNHRFLDISLRLPEMLNHLEMKVRERLQNCFGRGKITVNLAYNPGELAPFQLSINPALLKQLVNIMDGVEKHFDQLDIDFLQLLKWPGILTVTQQHTDELVNAVYMSLDAAISDLEATRHREGKKLYDFIQEKLEKILQQMSIVKAQLPVAEAAQRTRIKQRLAELDAEIDQQRLQQEILFYLQKIDIAEEVQRLQMHVVETSRVINSGGVMGRRLDFLIQEIQREANTMGTKSGDIIIQQASIELKVLIEQIREQVQNLE